MTPLNLDVCFAPESGHSSLWADVRSYKLSGFGKLLPIRPLIGTNRRSHSASSQCRHHL